MKRICNRSRRYIRMKYQRVDIAHLQTCKCRIIDNSRADFLGSRRNKIQIMEVEIIGTP